MRLELNIHKKYFLILLGAILVISAGIFVYAQASTPNPGHDISQIGGFPVCGANEALTHTDSGWSCVGVSSDGGSGGSSNFAEGSYSGSANSNNIRTVNLGFSPKAVVVYRGGSSEGEIDTYVATSKMNIDFGVEGKANLEIGSSSGTTQDQDIALTSTGFTATGDAIFGADIDYYYLAFG